MQAKAANLSLTQPLTTSDVFRVKKISQYHVARFLLVSLIGLLIFAIGGTISLISYQRTYAKKVMPNIILAGQSVAGLNQSQLDKRLESFEKQFKNSKNILFISPEIKVEATFDEMGILLSKEDTKAAVWQIGRSGSLINLASTLLHDSIYPQKISLSIDISQDQLDDFIDQKIEPLVKAPVDAKLELVGKILTVVDGISGLAIDTKSIGQDINRLAEEGSPGVVFVESRQVMPAVIKDDLEPLKTKLGPLVENTLTLRAGDKSKKIDSKDLLAMISFSRQSDQITASVNQTALEEYLLKNEKSLVIAKIDRQLAKDSGIVLREGKNGQKIDRNEAVKSLNVALSGYFNSATDLPQVITLATTEEPFADQIIDPAALASASAFDAAAPSGRSIVVDVSEQRLTAFESGQVVNTFLVSTGTPGYESPRGSFSIGRKQYSKWYHGYNRNGSYWSYPNTLYNMNFTSSYYLHGAYWHNNFGHKMSHGCINISYPNAEWLWNFGEVGTPVVVQD